MKRAMLFTSVLLFPLAAIAGEKVTGTDYFVTEEQTWQTGDDTGYWIWHGKGISVVDDGPLETGPTECHGAGFWDKDGGWGEGICVEGSGDDTRTAHWKNERGQRGGTYEYLSGTGRYAGITGHGSYTIEELPGGASINKWELEVTLPE